MKHGFDTSFLVAAEVEEHPEHAGAWRRIALLREHGDRFGITTAVLAEFVHVVTDSRRFTKPLTMAEAIGKARLWWEATEVETVTANDGAVKWFLEAMPKHQLGRKRVLDTSSRRRIAVRESCRCSRGMRQTSRYSGSLPAWVRGDARWRACGVSSGTSLHAADAGGSLAQAGEESCRLLVPRQQGEAPLSCDPCVPKAHFGNGRKTEFL